MSQNSDSGGIASRRSILKTVGGAAGATALAGQAAASGEALDYHVDRPVATQRADLGLARQLVADVGVTFSGSCRRPTSSRSRRLTP